MSPFPLPPIAHPIGRLTSTKRYQTTLPPISLLLALDKKTNENTRTRKSTTQNGERAMRACALNAAPHHPQALRAGIAAKLVGASHRDWNAKFDRDAPFSGAQFLCSRGGESSPKKLQCILLARYCLLPTVAVSRDHRAPLQYILLTQYRLLY